MRKNDARKWLHATLDLLPVILIPVFMIYSHRHTIDSYSITVPQNKIVTVKQDVLNGSPLSFSDWFSDYGPDVRYNSDYLGYACIFFDEGYTEAECYLNNTYFQVNDIVLFSCSYVSEEINGFYVSLNGDDTEITLFDDFVSPSSSPVSLSIIETLDFAEHFSLFFSLDSGYFGLFNVQLFNLTEMFGSGNEPTTYEEFKSYFSIDYYAYDSTATSLVSGTPVTYNDTDIMSQMFYNLYNSVDKYFNMNNVFGFGNIYKWFELNIFGGNAPISIYIVWNIVLYEFIMDLLMLLYALFMFFIDMCKKLIDKPLESIK